MSYAFLPTQAVTAESAVPDESLVVAVVLAGGGALGFSHIGVIRAIEEAGIDPDIVVGTSIGSIVGALYAAGYSADEMETIALETNWKEVLFDVVPRRSFSYRNRTFFSSYYLNVPLAHPTAITDIGASHAQRVVEFLDHLFDAYPAEIDFDLLPRRYRAVTADLITGERVVYRDGDLKTVIRASMAVPGVFTPVYYRDRYHIDGGWIDNTPVVVAEEIGADIVIAVPLGELRSDPADFDGVGSLLDQVIQIKDKGSREVSIAAADVVIRPNLDGFTPFDYEKGALLIQSGYRAAQQHLSSLTEIAERQTPEPAGDRQTVSRRPESGRPSMTHFKISSIDVVSATDSVTDSADHRELETTLRTTIPKHTTVDEIRERVYRLFDEAGYAHAWYRLIPGDGDTYRLEVDAEKRKIPQSRLGFGVALEGSFTDNTASSQRIALVYNRFLDEQQRYAVVLQTWISELSSIKASVLVGVNHRFTGLGSVYTRHEPEYNFDDEKVNALYSRQRTGAELTAIFSPVNSTALVLRPYAEYRTLEHRYGEKLFDDKPEEIYGITAMVSADTLDRLVTPNKGLSFTVANTVSFKQDSPVAADLALDGELYVPLSRKLTLEFWTANQSLVQSSPRVLDLPALGGLNSVHGYYQQEIRATTVAAVGSGMRRRIATLPLGIGNEVYIRLFGNGVASWDEDVTELTTAPSIAGGLSLGLIANTLLGEASVSVAVNETGRVIGFVGLRNSVPNILE